MLSTTDAIVLSLQPHSDKAHILHAYTRVGGRVNYMVYGLGRKHAIGNYTPFSLIQITADNHPSKPSVVKEVTPLIRGQWTLAQGQSPIVKQTIALFLSEVLFHTLRHPMPDEAMFDFIAQSVRDLDADTQPQNFHLQFLVGFAEQLGFAINSAEHADLLSLPQTRTERQHQLRCLCSYFNEHVETWSEPRSLDVLMEIFD